MSSWVKLSRRQQSDWVIAEHPGETALVSCYVADVLRKNNALARFNEVLLCVAVYFYSSVCISVYFCRLFIH